MEERFWIGKIKRVGDKTPNYLHTKNGNIISFRTIKNKCDIGYYDENKDVLYLNDDYRMQFKAIKKQIIKDYAPKSITEYFNLPGLTI